MSLFRVCCHVTIHQIFDRFLYALFVCLDANFRLKNNLVSNYSNDPGLGPGMAYLIPNEPYEPYVLSQASEEDVCAHACQSVLLLTIS